jgi:hypothetical protein
MSALLSESKDGRWFRENVEVVIVPFMDKDGVEEGDQGKNRKPHDHNRDYIGESIHPYRISDNIPFGTGWNTDQNYKQGKSCARWAAEIEGIRMATTIEIPYGTAGDTAITQKNIRAFGTSLVYALRLYLLDLQ